ncbi:glycosyltransferase [Priestia koreensis]|uniref:glycosyltransferase n=1 Tax=Priestia koreensis TaxID=284581 RepID=UPI003016DABB
MRVLHLISGGETGGSKNHLISLLRHIGTEDVFLGVFQEGLLSEEARQAGVPVTVFKQKSRYDFSVLSSIRRFMKENQIDIIHTHGPRANTFTFLLRKTMKFTWITTIHSDPRQDFIKGGVKGKIFTKINMAVIKSIDHFFAVSERFKDMIVGFGVNSSKITTIYNGIEFDLPLENKLTRQEVGLAETDFVVTMVARLHPIKGHKETFEAICQLKDEIPNVKLLSVGNGPMEDELKSLVKEKSLEHHVLFAGFQKDVHSFLSLSDVKLLASYSESFPLVILESARAHVPVISTDVGGVKDMISDSSLGWIIPTKDAGAIAGAIREAFHEKATGELSQKGMNLYKKASANYSVKQLADATIKTYQGLL